jgi:hypothetical protein
MLTTLKDSLKPLAVLLSILSITSFSFAADAPTTRPAEAVPATAPAESPWPKLAELLGLKGTEKKGVYTVTIPRTDLYVTTPDAGEIPVGAGLESTFHFFMCPCGKTNVIGTFLLADYESSDVIDELRAAQIHVVSVAPALYNETPRLLTVRFQGEGQAEPIASAIKAAVGRTGEARNPKIDLGP